MMLLMSVGDVCNYFTPCASGCIFISAARIVPALHKSHLLKELPIIPCRGVNTNQTSSAETQKGRKKARQ
jgi:hypothetical protein